MYRKKKSRFYNLDAKFVENDKNVNNFIKNFPKN